ncbi:hypothetical protein D9M71_512670 [compost metagenome]
MPLDRRATTAGVARHGVDVQGVVRRQQAGLDQWVQQRDGAGGIAAGIADTCALRDALGLLFVKLRQAIHPAWCGAVRRAGVDHPHLWVVDCGHGLAGGVVGQAQQGDVGAVDRFAAALRVLALGLGEGQQAKIATALQAGMDLQACGALVAVDENNRGVHARGPVGER